MKYLPIIAALAVLPSPAFAAELLVNGGFENPNIANPCCNTVPTASLPGWTVNFGNVNVVNGTYASSPAGTNLAFQGTQYLDLVGEGGLGSLSQTFATTAGRIYTLSFAYSHNLFNNNAPPPESATFSVGSLAGVIAHNTGSNANLDWRTYTSTFTATGSSSTLNFTNLTGGANEGIFLDAVSIQGAIPEPATWAMLILGFGFAGTAMRTARRRKLGLLAQA